jgi:hypothetical protein
MGRGGSKLDEVIRSGLDAIIDLDSEPVRAYGVTGSVRELDDADDYVADIYQLSDVDGSPGHRSKWDFEWAHSYEDPDNPDKKRVAIYVLARNEAIAKKKVAGALRYFTLHPLENIEVWVPSES